MAEMDCTLGRFKRVCVTCGKVFEIGSGRGQARRYCEPACSPGRKKPTKYCDCHDCERLARSNSAKYCETHYYRIRRNGSLAAKVAIGGWNECQYCGSPSSGRKYCNAGCRARAVRGNPLVKQCVVCAQGFDPRSEHGPDSIVCSDRCRSEHDRRIAKAHYQKSCATPEGADRYRRNAQSRRARVRRAFVEPVSWLEVMKSGAWMCHLCGEPIPRQESWPSPMFGTIDHVVPLALGGKHEYANCKPAHLTCNTRKGARLVDN